ncbi:hypothetical protein DL771_012399 [Monosporascus sp. 5C6A]|nr:hypothetical protein DL771_012399 [Monosporascus sp. 5C6A]
MNFAFQNVVGFILKQSKLTVSLIRIDNITADSFHVSIEARTSNTGPASATLSAFTIDLCGPVGRFGQVYLPAITTNSNGAPIIVSDQLVKILDKAALQAFIKPVIVDSHATLILRNGNTTVKALGIGPKPICYEKDIPMSGMLGPRINVHEASAVGDSGLAVVIHVVNPSPMAISFGACGLEIQNETGQVFAELTGNLNIRCNRFEAKFEGPVRRDIPVAKDKVRLVGKRCMGADWCDETVRQIDVPLLGMSKICAALGLPYDYESDEITDDLVKEPAEKSAEKPAEQQPLMRTASKLLRGRFWRAQAS